jgi:hypothetical protein
MTTLRRLMIWGSASATLRSQLLKQLVFAVGAAVFVFLLCKTHGLDTSVGFF